MFLKTYDIINRVVLKKQSLHIQILKTNLTEGKDGFKKYNQISITR